MRYLSLLLLFFTGARLAAQTQFYVSPAGSDTASGTLLQPFETVQHALDRATPGCTIYLMGGTYSEHAVLPVSGTAMNPITLTNYNHQHAVIDGSSLTGGPLFYIEDKNYFTLEGIEFAYYTHNHAQGILIEGSCNGIKILYNTLHDIHFSPDAGDVPNAGTNAQPLLVYGDNSNSSISNLLVRGNEIYNCRTGYSDALSVTGNVDGFLLADNKVHDNSSNGIGIKGFEGVCADVNFDQARNGTVRWNSTWNNSSPYAAPAGIELDGAKDCVLENNSSYGNVQGIVATCSNIGFSASGIIIRNNLVYKNFKSGIVAGGAAYPVGSGKLTHSFVQGNTISENNLFVQAFAELEINYTENLSCHNNIICSAGTSLLVDNNAASVQLQLNSNLYYSNGTASWNWNGTVLNSFSSWTFYSGNENASLYTDPLFVNGAQNNFHLQSISPAIDAGDSLFTLAAGETDMDTMLRLQNARVDIGADEFGTTVGIVETAKNTALKLGYNNELAELNVFFTNSASKNTSVKILDIDGKLIEETELKKGRNSVHFNISNLARGTYIVYAGSDDPQATKFVRY